MSMKKRQKDRAIKTIVQQRLKSMAVPSSFMVEKSLLEAFKHHAPGTPSFQHQHVKDHSISDPHLYNNGLYLIRNDLEAAFEEMVEQGRLLESAENLREIERKASERMLRKVQMKLDDLEEKLKNPFIRNVISDDFHTFNKVEFKGNPAVGQPETTVEIDLEAGTVTLPVVASRVMRHDLSVTDVNIEPSPSTKLSDETPFEGAIRDHINNEWRYTLSSKEETASVTLTLTLPEAVPATKIKLDARTPEGMKVLPSISQSGSEWKPLLERLVNGKELWQFNEQEVKAIQFVLTKEIPDRTQGTENEFVFSIQNLSLSREPHESEGVLVSSPFDMNGRVVDEILLDTEDTVGPDTDIRYYLGFEDETFIEWQEVTPRVKMHLNQLDSITERFEASGNHYGDPAGEFFGVHHHKVGECKETPSELTMDLYAGDYMWQVETKPIPDIYPYELPSLADWTSLKATDTAYVPAEQMHSGKQWKLKGGTLQRFSIDVLMEKDEEVYNVHLENGEGKAQVYLNNEPLRPTGNNRYTYRLKKGWNRIQIVTYAEKDEPFATNLYFKDIAKEVLANREPLKQVDPWHLETNVPKRDIRHFSLDGRAIKVNYDPKAYDLSGEGVRYKAVYRYVPDGIIQTEKLRLMAVLENRGDGSITPVLRKYKLILK